MGFAVVGGRSSLQNWGMEVASVVEMKGRRREEERGVKVRGGRDRKEGKEEGVSEITKMPHLFLGPKLLDTRHH